MNIFQESMSIKLIPKNMLHDGCNVAMKQNTKIRFMDGI